MRAYSKLKPIRHEGDVAIIVRIIKKNGYDISPYDAQMAWEDYSDSMAAGWMGLPESDAEVWDSIRPYLYFEEKNDR
jgi:hypothetical protein